MLENPIRELHIYRAETRGKPYIVANSVTKTCEFDMRIVRLEAARFGVEWFNTGLAIAFLVWNVANPGVKP